MGPARQRVPTTPSQKQNYGLKIMYTNARSIVNKIQELRLYAHTNNPDIIAITESWTNSSITNQYLDIPNYTIVSRHDRNDTTNGRGGGILIYVKHPIKSYETTSSSQFNQFASIEVSLPNDIISLYVIYRSPNSSSDNNKLLIEVLKQCKNPAIVVGDFNYPNIKWDCLEGCNDSQDLIDCSLDKFWTQWVLFPTHNSGNVLDLVFAEDGMINEVVNDSQLGNSDHAILIIETNQLCMERSRVMVRPDYGRADFKKLRNLFKSCNWSDILGQDDVNECWEKFKETYYSITDECIPQKRCKDTKRQPPWMTSDLKLLIRKKRLLWKRYKANSSDAAFLEFKKTEKSLKKSISNAKRNFEKRIAKNSKQNPKAFYAYIGNKRSNRTGVGPLQDDHGNVETDDAVQAEMFNKYFASVFEKENDMSHYPIEQHNDVPLLQTVEITELLVKEEIKKLKQHCTPGPDGIANAVLLEACDELARPLTILFKKSLEQSVVPEDWKMANVTPIHKAGNKKLASNYRPISLTSSVCKILETILKSLIMSHLVNNNLINSSQHGFMTKKSCLTNLLHSMEEVTKVLDEGDSVDVLYLDFAKAFDKVQHQRLLLKMQSHNISGQIYEWIKAWLSNRKQRVVLNGKQSSWLSVPCSVCQGTVLGPILFIIFIDDIDICIKEIEALILKFADDTKLIKRIRTAVDNQNLQDIITKLYEWATKWQMYFNVDKCKIVHLGSKNPLHQYYMNGSEIQAASSEKDLGVMLDNTAKPSLQCAKAAQKGNQVLGQLLRSFQCREKEVLTQLYKVFVRPHLEYAIQAWCPYLVKDIDILEKVQKRMVRQISNLQGSYEEKLKKIGLTTLQERRLRGDCIETFKMIRGFTRVDYSVWFSKISRPIGIQTRLSTDPLSLQTKSSRLDLRKNFFSVRTPPTWNALPLSLRQSSSVNQFKIGYDKHKN